MTAYTSTGTGDWNNAATWGGGGYPNASGDTATIGQYHVVTIPTGVSITCGAITMTGGSGLASNLRTFLVNNGTLDLAGNLTRNLFTNFEMGPGAILDLNGNNVVLAGNYTVCSFLGTSGSPISIISTGSRGAFTYSSGSVSNTWQYVNVSGLGDCIIGSGGPYAEMQSFEYCTFDDCGELWLEYVGGATDAGILLSHCDFTNPYSATPVASNKGYPSIYITAAYGANPRLIEYCTWSTTGSASNLVSIRCDGGLVVKGCIFNDVVLSGEGSSANFSYTGNFFCNKFEGRFFKDTLRIGDLTGNYFVNRYGDHPMGAQSFFAQNVLGNVFETDNATNLGSINGVGSNWFLWGTGSGVTIKLKNNLCLGTGSLVSFTGTCSPTLMDVSRNTFHIDNGAEVQGTNPIYFAAIYTHEQAGANTGTIEIYDNIVVEPDSSHTRENVVDLYDNTADQIDFLGYNCGWGYPAGSLTPPVTYSTLTVVTAGVGTTDFSSNPTFVDRTRNLRTWGATLGGSGTTADTVERIVAKETGYTIEALFSWVWDGFKFSGSGLKGTGRYSGNVGAANYYNTARNMGTIESARTLLSSLYV